MNDGGASDIEDQIEVYLAGSANRLPEIWKEKYKQFAHQNDPDYNKCLALKERFE